MATLVLSPVLTTAVVLLYILEQGVESLPVFLITAGAIYVIFIAVLPVMWRLRGQ